MKCSLFDRPCSIVHEVRVLGLQDDFLKLGADDLVGKKLQDIKLLEK